MKSISVQVRLILIWTKLLPCMLSFFTGIFLEFNNFCQAFLPNLAYFQNYQFSPCTLAFRIVRAGLHLRSTRVRCLHIALGSVFALKKSWRNSNGILPYTMEPYLGFYQTSKPYGNEITSEFITTWFTSLGKSIQSMR